MFQDSVTTLIVQQDSEILGLSERSSIFNCNENLKGKVEKEKAEEVSYHRGLCWGESAFIKPWLRVLSI